jgi:hypothetical protein
LPQYAFAPGLAERFPAVCAFVRQFLETCLAGDYRGYRRLVSRAAAPEPEERFMAIYRDVRRVRIDSIEALPAGAGGGPPAPFHVVITSVEFDPQSNVALRRGARQIAIAVFEESGEQRMAPAPDALQPRPAAESAAATQSATTGPSYPWDESGDD